jgi:hypothetical protein
MTTQITTDLNALWAAKLATDRLIQGKALLQNASQVIIETNAGVQAIVNEGAFTGVPADILNALNAGWTALKNCQTALADPGIQEALNWAGNPAE